MFKIPKKFTNKIKSLYHHIFLEIALDGDDIDVVIMPEQVEYFIFNIML